jgi:hypothetical protein
MDTAMKTIDRVPFADRTTSLGRACVLAAVAFGLALWLGFGLGVWGGYKYGYRTGQEELAAELVRALGGP